MYSEFMNAVFHEVHGEKKAFKCQMLGTWTIPITGHALCVSDFANTKKKEHVSVSEMYCNINIDT